MNQLVFSPLLFTNLPKSDEDLVCCKFKMAHDVVAVDFWEKDEKLCSGFERLFRMLFIFSVLSSLTVNFEILE